MRVEAVRTKEGKCIYKGVEFDVQITRFSKHTEVKFGYEIKRDCYGYIEGYSIPNWLDKLTWCKPVVWLTEKLNNRAKEKLYVRAVEIIRKKDLQQ